ncbi:MAG: HNH endonuclease [Myxococcota bacterium]
MRQSTPQIPSRTNPARSGLTPPACTPKPAEPSPPYAVPSSTGTGGAPQLHSATTHSTKFAAPRTPSVTHLDSELHRLSRGGGRLRLRIGQALHRLGDGIRELGFSTLGAYALERCNRGPRWAAETRTLARRLQSLPHLTHTLESGAIGWSMAELLARHATPETEAALLQVARRHTVQSMRIALTPQTNTQNEDPTTQPITTRPTHTAHPEDPDGDLTRTLSLTLPVEEAWALEATRMMVAHMDGTSTGAHFLESLLAEATIPLLDLHTRTSTAQRTTGSERAIRNGAVHESAEEPQAPEAPSDPDSAAGPDIPAQMRAEAAVWHAQMQHLQLQQANAEQQSRPQVPTNFANQPVQGSAPGPSDLPDTLSALDARIRHYSAELASRDLFFGHLAQRFLSLRGWQALGFTNEAHYARERLGMSRSSLRGKVTLARRATPLPLTTDALQQGRIGLEAAQLIARVATPTTERAWLARATRRTFKHLREEVQAVELTTRYLTNPRHEPPSNEHLAQIQELERAILSGEFFRKLTKSKQDPPVQISVGPNNNESGEHDRTSTPNPHPNQDQLLEGTPVQISVGLNRQAALSTESPKHQHAVPSTNGSPNDNGTAASSGSPANDPTATDAPRSSNGNAPHNPVQISVASAAKVTLRIRLPGDLLLYYRQLERVHGQAQPGESFVQFLCTEFWQIWAPALGTSDRWEPIYRRDRYRCTSPVCRNRNVTLHHIKYRANGGTDDAENLTSPCAFCHLEGEHGGRLKILPPGSNPTWLLGRKPIIRVEARERTLLA